MQQFSSNAISMPMRRASLAYSSQERAGNMKSCILVSGIRYAAVGNLQCSSLNQGIIIAKALFSNIAMMPYARALLAAREASTCHIELQTIHQWG